MVATFILASVMLAGGGKGLPIVHGTEVRDVRAARYLQSCVEEMTGVSVFFLAAFESKRLLRKIPTSSTFYEFVYEFWFPDCEF